MGLLQTHGWKFRTDLDYMTRAEQSRFKMLVDAGEISFFKTAVCPCGRSIPKIKKYCSIACKEKEERQETTNEAGQMD